MRKSIQLSFDEGFVDGLRKRGKGQMSQFIEQAVGFYINEKEFVKTVTPMMRWVMVICLACKARFSIIKCSRCPACGGSEVKICATETA